MGTLGTLANQNVTYIQLSFHQNLGSSPANLLSSHHVRLTTPKMNSRLAPDLSISSAISYHVLECQWQKCHPILPEIQIGPVKMPWGGWDSGCGFFGGLKFQERFRSCQPNHWVLERRSLEELFHCGTLRLTGVEPSGIPSHQYNSKLGS